MRKSLSFLSWLGFVTIMFATPLIAQDFSGGPSTLKTFQVYIDRDADPSTGFEALLNDGTTNAVGVELLLTVTVNAGPAPMVVLVEAQQLDGDNSLLPPYFTDASGWPVGTNNGTTGSDVVEAYMPLDRLGITQDINLFIQSGAQGAAFDIAGPSPFMFGVPIPTLGQWMLLFYIALFLVAALWFLRRQRSSKSRGLLALLAVGALFGATCNILLDGQIGDWTDPALVTDPVDDAADDAVDILAFFTCYDNQDLFVRFDVEELENQPPIPDDQMVTLLEDTPTTITVTATDVNGNQLTFSADSGPTNGALGPFVSTGLDSAEVEYTPNADFNGDDTFTFLVDDANGGTAIGTVTLTIDPVNDVPSFTAGPQVSVSKDTGAQVINGWATGISAGPANEAGQNLTFIVNVTSNPGVFAVPPTIDGTTGDLSFTPDADNNGTATLEISLMDDGGTANGGVDTSAIQMADIVIGAVNDAPTFTAGANQTHNEDDGAITVNAWATAISAGPPDEAGQMLTFNAAVTSDPGSIFAIAPAVDAATGDLSYTLAADAFGVATVDITLMDDGGTANGGVDTSPPQTLTITVNEVNDAPSFANTGNVNVFKGGSTETIPAWASAISAGPANESSQVLTFNVSVDADPDSVLGSIPSIDTATGNLSFDTTADNNGTATITVTLMDDGGTANGGVDTSAAATIDIIVGAVNDAPTFTAGADQTHNEDDGAINVMAWATAISAGPPDEAGQILTFNAAVTNDPGSIFAMAPAIDATTGNLTYTLAADAFGVATVDVTLMDDGGTANGGVDTSPPHTLTITVNEVNDAPIFTNAGNVNVFKGGSTETIPAWATALSRGPANEAGQSFVGFNVVINSDPNSVLGNTPTVSTTTGNLVFDTTADNNGTANVTITLMDDGGTANGGVDTSAGATIDIIVGAVNDAPTFTAGADQTHNEDDGAINVMAWATAISAGPPDEAGQILTFNAMVTSDPGSIFAVAPAVDATTGNLTYTLAADAFGVATVDVTLMDDGGTANGGVDTSPPQTLTITVNEINDAPSFANTGNVNVFKGGSTETIPAWASAISAGPANESGQVLTFNVSVDADPSSVLGSIPSVDPTTGNLSFDTTADNNGTATITVTLMDDGGTANGGVDTSAAATIDIIVGSVNDAPTFTAGADQTHNEDDGAINVMAWATAISAGPPDESGQILTFNAMITSDPGSIFAVPPAVDATTGNLTYTLATDAFGVATVDITLMDDGGTANGGVDTSAPHTLTITVNAVNDAPSFTNAGTVTAVDDGNTDITAAWATMLSTGPTNESGQSLTGFNVMVTSDPNSVLGTTPTVDVGTGNLSFDTVMGNTGDATISVTLMDDGGTANGGVDTSAAAVITITVNPQNSPPVASDDSFDAAVHTLLEVGVSTAPPGHEIAGSVLTSGTPDSDPDPGTTLIVTGTSNLTAGAVLNMNADGTFTLLPPPNTTTGTVTFDYTISDQHPTAPLTDMGTVTITLHDPVWYVKNDHGGPSEGTSENPFQTLAEAEAASAPNHKIFVFTGDGTTTGHDAGITLKDGQSLIGERADLVLDINGTMSTIVTGSGMASSAPRIGAAGNVVTLADDNLVRGLILLPTPAGGPIAANNGQGKRGVMVPSSGIFAAGAGTKTKTNNPTGEKRAGGVTLITEVLINPAGTSDGLNIFGQTGNFSFTNSEITGLAGSTGLGLLVDSSSATFTFSNLNISNLGTGAALSGNTSAGPITFNNADFSACTFTAVDLGIEGNDVTFDANCDINQTTGGRGVTITGGINTYSFNGPITVSNMSAGNDGIRINGLSQNPIVNFAAVTIDASTGQHGVILQSLGATGDINFNGVLDINGAGGDGFRMNNVSGSVDVTQATSDIASAQNSGVIIFQGAPTFVCNGTITNNSTAVQLESLTGGNTNFNGTITHGALPAGTGIILGSSAGTHLFERINIGTMATFSPSSGIQINSCTGTFTFENFDIFAVGSGLVVIAGNPTINTLTTGTVGNITSSSLGIRTFAGSLDGRFTNITVGTMATPASGPGLQLFGAGGGTVAFEDIDINLATSGNAGIEINGKNASFDAASNINIATTSHGGVVLQNGDFSGQIDSVRVTTNALNAGVQLLNQTGTLAFGLVDINTANQLAFQASNAGTITVTDPASSLSSNGNHTLFMDGATIGPAGMVFADITTNNTAAGNAVSINNVAGGTLQITDLQASLVGTGRSGLVVTNSSATVQVDGGNVQVSNFPGINLVNNTGTFNLSGLAITGTTLPGLNMTGGGTIQVTGTNTIATTSGTALNIANSTIAAAGVTFQSINSNGATNGIRLDNTGALGGLRVTGTGGNDTGGNIQNSTTDAIFLNNTISVSLTDMQVNNSTDSHINATMVNGITLDGVDFFTSGFHGINGSNITGLNMVDCTLDISGNAANEHGMRILNLLGSSNITSTDFTRSATIQAFIQNTSASVAAPAAPADILTFDDCTFGIPVMGTFGDNISVESGMTGNLRVILDDTTGQNIFVGGQDGAQLFTATGGTLDVVVDNVNVQTTSGVGINIGGFNASDLTFDVRNIDTLNTGSIGINVTSIGGADMSGIIDNNIINGSTMGQGIQVITEGNGDITATISNNDIDNIDSGFGIRVQARAGSGTINATINNNDVDLSAGAFPLEGIGVESGSSAGGDTNTICLNMFGNTSVSNFNEGYRLRHRPGTTFNLQDFVGMGSNPADVTTWINTTKSNTGTTQITGTGFTAAPVNCPTPP